MSEIIPDKIKKYIKKLKNSPPIINMLNTSSLEAIQLPNGPFVKINQVFKETFHDYYQGDYLGKYSKDILPLELASFIENSNEDIIYLNKSKFFLYPIKNQYHTETLYGFLKLPLKLDPENQEILIGLVGIPMSNQQAKDDHPMNIDLNKFNQKEILNLVNNLQNLALATSGKLEEKTKNFKNILGQLEKILTIDSLTGIYNRRKFEEYCLEEMKKSSRYKIPLSLLIIDIDNFKKINDRHGHLFGDKILQELSDLINKNIRDTDLFARWGGEEFVLVSHIEEEIVYSFAEKIRKLVEQHRFEVIHSITISIGLSQYRIGESLKEWFERSDQALYQAKTNGKNKVKSYNKVNA